MSAVLAALRLHSHPLQQQQKQSHWHGKWRSSVWCHHNANNSTTNNSNRINNNKKSNTNLADIAFAIGFSRFRSIWKCICRFPISTHISSSSSVRNVRCRCRCCSGPRYCGFCWTYACNTSCTSQLTTRSQKVSTQQTLNVCAPSVYVCLLRFSHWK